MSKRNRNNWNASSTSSVIISKSFDDGHVLNIVSTSDDGWISPLSEDEFVEYEVMQSDDFVEYDVEINKELNPEGAGDINLAGTYTVESFGDKVEPIVQEQKPQKEEVVKKTNCECLPIKVDEKKSEVKEEKVEMPKREVSSPVRDPLAKLKEETKSLTDDDFMADMESILSGKKVFDSSSKKIVDKSKEGNERRQQKELDYEKSDDEIKPLDQKSEHAIFDRIAQSMRFANAYDLGSVSLEKRFDEFDELDGLKGLKPKKYSSSSVPGKDQRKKEQAMDVVTSTEDFIKDLDLINKEKEVIPTEINTNFDLGLGGFPIDKGQIKAGDLIFGLTKDKPSLEDPAVAESKVLLCLNNNQVLDVSDKGLKERGIEEVSKERLLVLYRAAGMNEDKATKVIDFIKKAAVSGSFYSKYALLVIAPEAILSKYCKLNKAASEQQKCLSLLSYFKAGVDVNNSTNCPALLMDALQQIGLGLSDVVPAWDSTQNTLMVHYNDSLSYLGHVKV